MSDTDNTPTYYHQQVLALHEKLYGRSYLWARVQQSRRFMDNNFHQHLDVDAMAREACLSKFHFIRLFKTYYGRTPYQYLTDVRIAHAKTLLRSGTPVVEVCEAVGFASVTSFTTLFRRMTGRTPNRIHDSNRD